LYLLVYLGLLWKNLGVLLLTLILEVLRYLPYYKLSRLVFIYIEAQF
jgi:hypothetical protein